jgi:hypothetical protein
MRLYVKFQFSSNGKDPLTVAKLAREIGFAPEVGEYDCSMPFKDPERYGELVTQLHDALKGAKVYYTLITKER